MLQARRQYFKIPSSSSARWQMLAVTRLMQHISSSHRRIKGIFPKVLFQIGRDDFYPNHTCKKWKIHLRSSRTWSYWINFENKKLKNIKLAPVWSSPLLWRHFFIWMHKANSKATRIKIYIKIISDMCKEYTWSTILSIYITFYFHGHAHKGQMSIFPFWFVRQ